MEESNDSTGFSAMFSDNYLLQQPDWDYLLRNKLKFENLTELSHDNIKKHVRKLKDEM